MDVLDLGRFSIDRDAGTDAGPRADGGRDAGTDGGRDAGPDACVPQTYYLDLDGDTYGDPATGIESCAPIEGRVTNGDDCDDGSASIRPGVTETCDDVDQDCDGAVDEGLMRPLGDPVVVVPDFGFGDEQGAAVVATNEGYAVIWRRGSENVVRGSFFARDGTPFAVDVFIEGRVTGGVGPDVRNPTATRFTIDDLDQVFVAWFEPDGIRARSCSTRGTCSRVDHTIWAGDTSGARNLGLSQLRNRIVARWTNDTAGMVASLDPITGSVSAPAVLPGGTDTRFLSIATVDGPAPYVLVVRRTGMPDDAPLDLMRVRGIDALSFDEAMDILPWDYASRCAALGRAICGPLGLLVAGRGASEAPSLLAIELLAATDTLDGGVPVLQACAFPATPTDTSLDVGPCVDVPPSLVLDAVVWGSSATVIAAIGAELAIRQIGLTADTTGAGFVSLPGMHLLLGAEPWIAMHRAHGAVVGNSTSHSGFDVAVTRIGCEP